MKTFIYLDDYKMKSLGSQLMGGLTDTLDVLMGGKINEEIQQSGGFATGRLNSSLTSEIKSRTERKSMHDSIYLQFEDKLIEDNFLREVKSNSDLAEDYLGLIKISGKIKLFDTATLVKNLKLMPELIDNVLELQLRFSDNKEQIDESMIPVIIEQMRSSMVEGFSSEVINKIANLLSIGFNNHIEIQIDPLQNDSANIYSSTLNPEYLRDDIGLFSRKYSSNPQGVFSIVGIVCQQTKMDSNISFDDLNSESEDMHVLLKMKYFITQMADRFQHLSEIFLGRRKGEIVIDPIAIYREIS